MLNIGVSMARKGLAELADTSWLMSLPRQDPRSGHPGGHPAAHGRPADGVGAGTIAVTFGQLAVPAEADALLTVRWESAEPGDQFTVLLDADIILGPAAGQASSVLTLAGSCRLPPGTLITSGYELARAQVIETAREFITSVADAVTCSGAQGQGPRTRGEAQSWMTGIPRQQLPGGIRAEGLGEDRGPFLFGEVFRPVALALATFGGVPVLNPVAGLPDHHAGGGEVLPGTVLAADPAGAFPDHQDDVPGGTQRVPAALARGVRRNVQALCALCVERLHDVRITHGTISRCPAASLLPGGKRSAPRAPHEPVSQLRFYHLCARGPPLMSAEASRGVGR